jgi:hypothetical protein
MPRRNKTREGDEKRTVGTMMSDDEGLILGVHM